MKNPTQSAKTISEFRGRIFEATARIPAGFVTTYGELAGFIGCGSARAVGQALRENPFAPAVPCHRVVKSDGSLGGFFGSIQAEALQKKRSLLESEGVTFDSLGRVKECFILQTW